jgi:hypothetical protein
MRGYPAVFLETIKPTAGGAAVLRATIARGSAG